VAPSSQDVKKVVTNRRILAAVLIGISVLLITYLHHSTTDQPLHSIYAELHYIPLLLAGLLFGFRGAFLTSLMVTLLYGGYIIADWHGASLWLVDNSIHVIFPAIFALLVGFLVDLKNSHRAQLEQNRYLSGLGQAAAVIVHDLKNPLLNVKAAIRRLEIGTITCEEEVTAVRAAIEKMERVMDGALDFSKPLQLNRREEDAAALIKELLQDSTAKAEQEGVGLTISVTEQPLVVVVDPAYLERALVNLVNNAIEASQKGQNVRIRLLKRNDTAIIKIRDYGKGMDKETLENLFIPFYSKKGSGTGLGMAVARKIVEEHQGRITVKSRPASGTRIAVHLPLIGPPNRT
jgi:two-component system, NtrC family, sensor histidine kinase HydH